MYPTDHFSTKSNEYSFSRPHYPESLFEYLSKVTSNREVVWDCATGNGQAAIGLCKYFKKVIASDMSKNQIENRFVRDNIFYEVFPAETANLSDDSIDLITVAQAIHWFNFERFYDEVWRVSKKSGSIIAVWSYGMHKINPEIDKISDRLTVGGDILGNYWPKETEFVKDNYETIPFPFEEFRPPKFKMIVEWSLHDLFSYMETWSSVKKFQLQNHYNPLDLIRKDFEDLWGQENKKRIIEWDLNLRIGSIKH
jgi:ubiquinone/menaquinone biosynthesis C-methylase UbiE